MFKDLLEPDYGVDASPPDATRITQVVLYYNEEDAAELRRLAKEAIKREWPTTYITEGNISDLYLLLLKKHYGHTPLGGEAFL